MPTDQAAYGVLAALLDYQLKPSRKTFDALRRAHIRAGGRVSIAEDVCRCAYYLEDDWGDRLDETVRVLTSVPPADVGAFWAGRELHEADREADALAHYQRALAADERNPRTRLFYAIALLTERRPDEALSILQPIPGDWAPQFVTYWRARALLDLGRATDARALLEGLPSKPFPVTTVPDASADSAPVQPPSPPPCLLGETLSAAGDDRRAREIFEKPDADCDVELARLELTLGRPFEAMLALESLSIAGAPELEVQALAALGSCTWARRVLEEQLSDTRWNALRTQTLERCPPSQESASVSPPELLARLQTARLVPFTERAVPSQWQWKGERPQDAPSTKAYPNLGAADVVALSSEAERMFAVSVSDDLDPRGEVSIGGYWLHLSSDRGRQWHGPYYLGFAHQFPYVVPTASRVPPFDGDRVQLEVERREVDESSITFPPVALRAKSVAKNRFLSIDVAAVTRDTDADGLTDLVEEKLLLDPRSPDTDGDGLGDGEDSLPLRSRMGEQPDRLKELMAAVIPRLFGGPPPIQHLAASGGEESTMLIQPRQAGFRPTLFVELADCPFSHEIAVRTICLSSGVFSRYRTKFGATYPMEVPQIAFDKTQERALIRYSFGWRGGTLLAARKDGGWELKVLTSWIT